MSRGDPGTRVRILEAARALLEAQPPHEVRMEDVGDAAGVSRQAVYLHFGSRGGLLLALVDHIDRREGLGEMLPRVWESASGVEALGRFVELVAEITPRIDAIALALESARATDEAAAEAWDDRMAGRLRTARRLAEWLDEDGALRDGWTVAEAADLIWAATAIHTWRDLVVERGWPAERYVRRVREMLLRALVERA